jgi:hypothetical protein
MKIFTVQEANALLPDVRNITGKIQRAHRQLSKYRDEARKASEAAEQGGGGMAEGVAYAAILTVLTTQLTELEALGVQLKDFSSTSLHCATAASYCSAGNSAKATNSSGGTTSTPGSRAALHSNLLTPTPALFSH